MGANALFGPPVSAMPMMGSPFASALGMGMGMGMNMGKYHSSIVLDATQC